LPVAGGSRKVRLRRNQCRRVQRALSARDVEEHRFDLTLAVARIDAESKKRRARRRGAQESERQRQATQPERLHGARFILTGGNTPRPRPVGAGSEQVQARRPRADKSHMGNAALDVAVFLFCFSLAYLISGRRRVLALSTRVLLLLLIGLAAGFAFAGGGELHLALGAATMTADVLFVAFVAIDFYRWSRLRAEDQA